MYTQRLNDFITVTGGVYAAKYNVYGVRFNDLGAKGKLSFRINDRMKINMFGTYSVYNGYGMTPASQLLGTRIHTEALWNLKYRIVSELKREQRGNLIR